LELEVEGVYAIVESLSTYRALDAVLFSTLLAIWEFVFQPSCAAYLNLIESWWKIPRSLAGKGRRFASWDEIVLSGWP
jgi:hypothetical protein